MLPPGKRLLQVLTPDATEESASRLSLKRLLILRLMVTVLSVLGTFIFHSLSPLQLPVVPLGIAISIVAVSLFVGMWRVHKQVPISKVELFAQLLLDFGILILVVLVTGGASNPLISYLLVLLAVAATILHQRYVNLFAVASIAVYTWFLLSELQQDHSDHMMANFQLHLVGMWVTFVVSAVLITLFVTRMAEAIRRRELTLARARENEMRNEQLVAIGTLAAGTAHALGTPLSTMAVLLNDLSKYSEDDLRTMPIKEDIRVLHEQVLRCKNSLTELTHFYNKSDVRQPAEITLAAFMDQIQDYIVTIHPHATVHFELPEDIRPHRIRLDLSVRHAVINLIENAIKAARARVSVHCRLFSDATPEIEISIRDDGPGIPASVMENMGEPFISTRKESMGLGIFLANAAIQRADGRIEMFNLKSGGAMSVVRLPLVPGGEMGAGPGSQGATLP